MLNKIAGCKIIFIKNAYLIDRCYNAGQFILRSFQGLGSVFNRSQVFHFQACRFAFING